MIGYETSSGVITIRLQGPDRRNALSPETISLLSDALIRAKADAESRCVVLTGKNFNALLLASGRIAETATMFDARQHRWRQAGSERHCTGFGFSMMATPLLLLVHEPRTAIQLNIILSPVLSAAMLPRIRTEIDRPMLRRLIGSALLGIPLGAVLFSYLDPQFLRLAVGIIVLIVAAALVARLTFAGSRAGDRLTGLLSGAFTASLGMPGPPLLVYFAGALSDKAVVRGTTLAFFLFVYGGARC